VQFNQTGNQDIIAASLSGTPVFTVTRNGDASMSGIITLGSATSDPFTRTYSGQSTAVKNGSMYYNSTTKRFRCFENNVWRDCMNTPNMNYFSETNITEWGDDNTTELWDLGTNPNITLNNAANDVLVMVSVEVTAGTASDAENVAVVRRDTVANGAGCTDTIVGPQLGVFTTDSTTQYAGTIVFVDSPGSAVAHEYTVCTHADSEPSDLVVSQNDQTRIDMTLFEMNNAADLAEVYPTLLDDLEPGEVVVMDPLLPSGVTRSQKPYDSQLIGIVSTKPALVIGGTEGAANGTPIALTGRVPVRVTTENGSITTGDFLTTSSTPGVAMKATKAGPVLGQAMTDMVGDSDTGIVVAFVKTGMFFGDPESIINTIPGLENANEARPEQLLRTIANNDSFTQSEPLVQSTILADRLIGAIDIISPRIITEDVSLSSLTAADQDIVMTVGAGGSFVIKNQLGETLFSVGSNQIGRVLGLSGSTIDEATKSGEYWPSLSLTGESTASGQLSLVAQIFKLFDDEDGTRRLVFLPKAVFDGVVTFFNSVIFKQNVRHEGQVNFENLVSVDSDTAGSAVIPKWTTTVHVAFDKPYSTSPVVTISQVLDEATESASLSDGLGAAVANVTEYGFTITLKEPSPVDLTFNWIALGVQNKRTVVGESIPGSDFFLSPTPVTIPTPTLLPNPTPTTENLQPTISLPTPTPPFTLFDPTQLTSQSGALQL
jgi:hypothetical protein